MYKANEREATIIARRRMALKIFPARGPSAAAQGAIFSEFRYTKGNDPAERIINNMPMLRP